MHFLKTRIFSQLLILGILLVITWSGVRSLTIDTIWYDEWYSLYYAGAAPYYGPITPIQTVERALQYNEYNPPGYYVALNLWGHIAGWTPFAARTFSLLLGVFAVAVIYKLGCQMAGQWAGLGAVVGLGASAFFIQQLHELRMYALFPLLVLLTFLAYWQFIYHKPTRQSAVLFFISLLGLLYTHYMALPLVVSLFVYHLLIAPKNRAWWIISLITLICGLLYLPWLGIAFGALGVVSGEGARNFFANDALTLVNNMLTQFSNGVVPLFIVFGWYALRSARRSIIFVLFILVGTLGLIIIVNERLHFIGIARYLIGLWPVLALLLGLGIARMQNLHLRPLILMIVWCAAGAGLMFSRTLISQPKDPFWEVTLPWDKVAQTVKKSFFGQINDQDALVFLLPQPTPFWFHAPLVDYYLHDLRPILDNMPGWLHLAPPESPLLHAHLVESLVDTSPEMFVGEAQQFLTNTRRLWLAYNPTELPSPFARPAWDKVLSEQGFAQCIPFIQEPTLQLSLYARIDQAKLIAHFGDGIQVGLLSTSLSQSAKTLSLLLGWAISPNTPTNTYSMGIYIDDAQGQPVAQSDFGIPSPSNACNTTTISLAELPVGQYTISSTLYNWQTGERLSGQSQVGQVADRPQLGQLQMP